MTVNVYAVLGLSPVTLRLVQLPEALPAPEAATEHAAVPPPASTLNATVAVLKVTVTPVIVTVGLATVRAVAVPGSPSPASFTAFTSTATFSPAPKPVRVTAVPSVTSVVLPPAATRYFVTGRPLSTAACQPTWTAPAWSPTVAASTPSGLPGLVNGTTLALGGDAADPAPRSLIATTVNAYCLPYSSCPVAMVSAVPSVTSPIGALPPSAIAVTEYRLMASPWPFAAGQLTTTEPSGLASAVAAVGASGTSEVGRTVLLVRAGPSPFLFTACTRNW